ncbi:MAG: hypothetical protein WCS37_02325 [Chloroflexota bacterium]|nr:hypothetical protein [Chloroflexota bacterium]
MLRYLNTLVRYIWLLIIPVLLAPGVVIFVMGSGSSYNATGSLWVEQPLYLEQQRNSDGAYYDSPSTQMSNMLTELMNTRAFLTTVLDNTPSLKSLVKTEAENGAMLEYINKNFKVEASGWRLINVSFQDKDATPALETLEAVVNNFKSYYDDRIAKQGQGAIAYYQDQVKLAKEKLDQANTALVDFFNAHPNEIGSEGAIRATRPIDLEVASLTQNLDAARKQYDDAQTSLEKIQKSYSAYVQGQDTNFTILDKPAAFSTSSGKSRQLLMGGGIGLAIGLVVLVLGTIILTLLDRTIRQPFYAKRSLRLPRVIEVPNVNPVGGWYNWRKQKMLLELESESLKTKLLPAPITTAASKEKKAKSASHPKIKPRFSLRRSFGEQIQFPPMEQS